MNLHIKNPERCEERICTEFLIFPNYLNGKWKWLVTASWIQKWERYVYFVGDPAWLHTDLSIDWKPGWVDSEWFN